MLAKTSRRPTIVCDRDHIIAVAGVSKKEYLERRVTQSLEDIMQSRKGFTATDHNTNVKPVEGIDRKASVVFPIISSGDVNGAVVMLSDEENFIPSDTETKLVQTAAEFLGKQLEG